MWYNMCALRASCPRQVHASKIVTDADNRSHMRTWPAPYAYYTINKPTSAAQDETYGLRRKILGLRHLPPRNFSNRTTKKSCAFNVTGVLPTRHLCVHRRRYIGVDKGAAVIKLMSTSTLYCQLMFHYTYKFILRVF